MKATIIRRHYGVPENEVYPRWFAVGTVVSGQVAEAAIEVGDAVPFQQSDKSEPEPLSASPQGQVSPETKPKRRRGRPRKSSASMTPGD
jgi:hypothetical protein